MLLHYYWTLCMDIKYQGWVVYFFCELLICWLVEKKFYDLVLNSCYNQTNTLL